MEEIESQTLTQWSGGGGLRFLKKWLPTVGVGEGGFKKKSALV